MNSQFRLVDPVALAARFFCGKYVSSAVPKEKEDKERIRRVQSSCFVPKWRWRGMISISAANIISHPIVIAVRFWLNLY